MPERMLWTFGTEAEALGYNSAKLMFVWFVALSSRMAFDFRVCLAMSYAPLPGGT